MTHAISAKPKTTFGAVQRNVTLPAFVCAKIDTAGKVTTFLAMSCFMESTQPVVQIPACSLLCTI